MSRGSKPTRSWADDVKRTTIIYPFIGGGNIGGSHISALKLIAALDRSRFDPRLVLHEKAGALGDYIESVGLRYSLLEGVPILAPEYNRKESNGSILVYLSKTIWALRRVIRETGADIVHTNDGRMHINWSMPAKLAGCKHLWHHRQDPRSFGVNRVAPILADRIVSVSHFSKPANPIRAIEARFSVLRSPFDFASPFPDKATARSALCAEISTPDEALLIGFFGGLIERKRPLHFVRAIRAVQDALPDRPVHGLFFGEMVHPQSRFDEKAITLAKELGLSDKIHLMGFRNPITDHMAAVDAMLVTAMNEPFGRTLIEAMYLKTPVIATRHGGNPEAITDQQTGFLVEPENPAAFAYPVTQLVRDPDCRARIVAAAHADVCSKYGTKRHVESISMLYDELVPFCRS